MGTEYLRNIGVGGEGQGRKITPKLSHTNCRRNSGRPNLNAGDLEIAEIEVKPSAY